MKTTGIQNCRVTTMEARVQSFFHVPYVYPTAIVKWKAKRRTDHLISCKFVVIDSLRKSIWDSEIS